MAEPNKAPDHPDAQRLASGLEHLSQAIEGVPKSLARELDIARNAYNAGFVSGAVVVVVMLLVVWFVRVARNR